MFKYENFHELLKFKLSFHYDFKKTKKNAFYEKCYELRIKTRILGFNILGVNLLPDMTYYAR